MFYPVESLKRGGRFYLCWVADSWPVQFASLSQRQLWSYDIRKLCDDLMEVVMNESGRPACRFSLRLSAQLMRGLVRVYERKVSLLLGDLCMISAHVFKHANKKYVVVQGQVRQLPRPVPQEQLPRPELAADPQEQRLEEIIQNSGNVVANIQDITLKEATIPEIQLPPNDGFGEENPDQALQLLLQERTVEQILELDINQVMQLDNIADRTVEQMLHQPDISAAQHSGLDLEVDKSNKSNADKSRLVQDRQMERISEYDMPLMRKSTAPEQMEVDIEKDIPEIPEIVPQPPAIPDPEIPAVPQIVISEPEAPVVPEPVPLPAVGRQAPRQPEPEVDIELEELEQEQLSRRRRARRGPRHVIVDKRTKLSAAYLRNRIDNMHVEQRCEDYSDDIVDLRVPFETLSKRPAHAGDRLQARGSSTLLVMFQRRLVTEPRPFDRDIQESEPERTRRLPNARPLPNVPEEPEQPVVQEPEPRVQPSTVETADVDKTRASDVVPNISDLMNVTEVVPNLEQTLNIPQMDIEVSEMPQIQAPERASIQPMDIQIQPMDEQALMPRASVHVQPEAGEQPLDISEMPTQVLKRLSQVSNNSQTKRASHQQLDRPAKRLRPSGIHTSFRESLSTSIEKENIPPEDAQPAPAPAAAASQQSQKNVSTMLLEAGLADVQPRRSNGDQVIQSPNKVQPQASARVDSDNSETPLGSLDRTKVSLGDSDKTTDTQRFIRNHWGIEGTMVKILESIRRGSQPVTVHALIRRGPVMPALQGVMAARCFTSILKLRQHGFIKVAKDPESLEILDITLGPRFDGIEV